MNWRNVVLIVAAVLSLDVTVRADTIYTYTGNQFDRFSGEAACPPVCSISGSFTVAQPFAGYLPVTSVIPLSFSFTDGATTITQLTNTFDSPFLPRNAFLLATDSQGNIRAWFILAELGAAGLNTTSGIGGPIKGPPIDVGDPAPGSAFVSDNPGTWSVSATATPEPSGLLLMGSGIVGLGFLMKRRNRR